MQNPALTLRPALICALDEELGPLRERVRDQRRIAGLDVLTLDLPGSAAVLACVSGIGKVLAARAATVMIAEGASALLCAGVCGGLTPGLVPGTLVHASAAIQTDLWARPGREAGADDALSAAWRSVAPGPRARFLTADRAVFQSLRAARLRRAWPGAAVADMETAAIAAVAAAAGLPWAALRAVTDRPRWLPSGAQFRAHFPEQAGRAAATLPALLATAAGPLPGIGGLTES